MQPANAGSECFIGEPVEVAFAASGAFVKRPPCPSEFVWRGKRHVITETLAEWHDNARRGRMARNMRPSHISNAEKRGSWGVGRHYFRVRTDAGRVFDIYYDRAPRSALDRAGGWWLFRELPGGEPRAGGPECAGPADA
jgi:hypothetical protein